MPAFCIGDITFNYVDIGTGVPFVFEHGLGGDVRQPVNVFTPQQGVRLLALDARAHGETVWCGDPLELNFGTFADDLIALLNQVGVARAVVGGISMGAGVALNVAVRYPERVAGLVLSRPAWLDRTMPPRTVALYALIARLLRTLDYSADTDEGLDWAWRHLERDATFAAIAERYPDCAWSLRGQLMARRAVDGVARLERLPRDRPIQNLRAAATIRVPTLVLAHHDDPIHLCEFGTTLARAIPGAQCVEVTSKSIDRQRHDAQIQRAIAAFLDQYRDTPATVRAAA